VFAVPIFTGAVGDEGVNVGVIPAIWFSSQRVYEGNEIKIYGGIQNHSTSTVEGSYKFFVDGKELGGGKFVSKPESLIELNADWKATSGKHEMELKIIEDNLKNLWSYQSGMFNLEVTKIYTKEEVTEKASEVGRIIIERADNFTLDLRDKLETKRKEVVLQIERDEGLVLGTSTASTTKNTGKFLESKSVKSAFAIVLGMLAKTLEHWKITLAGVLALLLLYKLFK